MGYRFTGISYPLNDPSKTSNIVWPIIFTVFFQECREDKHCWFCIFRGSGIWGRQYICWGDLLKDLYIIPRKAILLVGNPANIFRENVSSQRSLKNIEHCLTYNNSRSFFKNVERTSIVDSANYSLSGNEWDIDLLVVRILSTIPQKHRTLFDL